MPDKRGNGEDSIRRTPEHRRYPPAFLASLPRCPPVNSRMLTQSPC